MSIPRGMDMRGPGQRVRAMPGAAPPPRSTMGDEQPFTGDDLAAALGAMMGVPVPQSGAAGRSGARAMPAPSPRGPTGTMIGQAPLDAPQPAGWFAPVAGLRSGGTQIQQPTPDMIKTVPPPMRGMQRTPVPPPGMAATGAMDDLPPLAPMHPDAMSSLGSKKMGWKYDGPDAADLARRYDDEWWANHAANPPPPMRPGPEEPLPPLPPPDPEFIRALQRSMQKTGR